MWTAKIEGGPRKVNHAAVPWRDKVFSFGGYCCSEGRRANPDIDVYCLNADNYRWTTVRCKHKVRGRSLPCRRYGHTVARYGDAAILWGGRNDTTTCDTLYTFDLETCTWNNPRTYGSRPACRDGHTATIINDFMFVFGGFDNGEDDYTTVLYSLHIPSMTWTVVRTYGEPPSGRDFHTATAYNHRIYFFGGRVEHRDHFLDEPRHEYENQVIVLDTQTKTWSRPVVPDPVPLGRRSHSAFLYMDFIFILGGYNSNTEQHLNDLWRFSPAENKWRQLFCPGEAPSVRRRHASCVIGSKVITFGGTSPEGPPLEIDMAFFHREQALSDKDDSYVLDFAPSLVTLCLQVVKNFPAAVLESLPRVLRYEIEAITTPNNISREGNESG